MEFLNSLLSFFRDFLESLFSSSSIEFKKKQQLKQIAANLKTIEPQLYRQDGFLLPAFPTALYQMFQFIVPISELLSSTIACADKRIAERNRDFLIEVALTNEQKELRKSFVYTERTKALIANTVSTELLIEEQGKHFGQFLKILESPTLKNQGVLIEKIFCLNDFCQFDFNGFFSNFDPAFKTHSGQTTTVDNPSFKPLEVAEVIPQMMDLHYLFSRLDISKPILDLLGELEAKKQNVELTTNITSRMERIFQALLYLIQKKISKENILGIIRLVKNDPDFVPEQPSLVVNHIEEYKQRLTEFFHSDSRKLLKEQQSNEIQVLLNETFGNRALEKLTGYTDTTNQLLQEFTPFNLEWIKPLEIIKTFLVHYFMPHYRQFLHSIIVEGYFANRSLQSSFAASFSYCEYIPAKLREFEQLFEDNNSCSLKIMTGYLTELQKGMDFETPLRKMVENMNKHARDLVQKSVTQLSEVFNFSLIIIEDNKKPLPDYITNIRMLAGSTKNAESFSFLEKEQAVFRNFLEIMKKYAIVGTLSGSLSLAEQTESQEK